MSTERSFDFCIENIIFCTSGDARGISPLPFKEGAQDACKNEGYLSDSLAKANEARAVFAIERPDPDI